LDPTAVFGPPVTEEVSQDPGVEIAPPRTFTDYGVDFSNHRVWMSLQIDPPNKEVNRGELVELSFIPGKTCTFGDHNACVNQFFDGTRDLVFLTIHSGVGGEAQDFRHAVEGTGINRAGYSLKKVQAKLNSLSGAQVAILQDGDQVSEFTLVGIARIPPEYIQAYLNAPIHEALALAVKLTPDIKETLDPSLPVVAFETCGWKMSGEPWLPGVTSTTGSIYLGIIQPVE